MDYRFCISLICKADLGGDLPRHKVDWKVGTKTNEQTNKRTKTNEQTNEQTKTNRIRDLFGHLSGNEWEVIL